MAKNDQNGKELAFTFWPILVIVFNFFKTA